VPLLYSLAAYLLAPWYCAALLWRGLRERGYWRHFGERFGRGAPLAQPPVWLHAASVGEVQAAGALIDALRERIPGLPLLVTTTTPAGAERARARYGPLGVEVRHVPLDLPSTVARFFARTRPRLAVILETEIWPNLYARCARERVPLALASARISPRSLKRYRLIGGLIHRALASCTLIGAQTAEDAARLAQLGATPAQLLITGNLKFDFALPADTLVKGHALRARYAPRRPLWVAGSTHPGEEAAALEAHRHARRASPGALLVLAPRHAPRFAEVAALLTREGVRFARRSGGEAVGEDTEVLLLDAMGELLDFYAAADVAFVGGSLVPRGGHNLLEPAALGVPILTGPHHTSAVDIARRLIERGAVLVVHDAHSLGERLAELLSSPEARTALGGRARGVLEENRGAASRLCELLAPLIAQGGPGEGPGAPRRASA